MEDNEGLLAELYPVNFPKMTSSYFPNLNCVDLN